jgi:glycoprotein 3-alpha-L-fucosyltransferase
VDVAVFISNCKKAGGQNRLKYVKEMMEYIPMHSYGGCLGNRKEQEIPYDDRWPKHDQRRARKHKTLRQYKFYLAFENTGVRDYVSEKVYDSLIGGALPVYRGAEGIRKFMPHEHSYVNGNGMSPKELADTLISLGKDEAAYNKYFEWKSEPLDSKFKMMMERSYTHPNVLCRLCDYAAMKRGSATRLLTESVENATNTMF